MRAPPVPYRGARISLKLMLYLYMIYEAGGSTMLKKNGSMKRYAGAVIREGRSLFYHVFWVLGFWNPNVLLADDDLTSWETLLEDEHQHAQRMGEMLIRQLEKEYVIKNQRVFRDAHSRGIGCVEASFQVNPDLSPTYRTGVFQEAGKTYSALIRFSNSLGPAGDHVKDARGMAIKLFGVPGEKLLPAESQAMTHDFLQIDAPFFPARDAREFAGFLALKSDPLGFAAFLAKKPILRGRELKALYDLSFGNPNNGKSLAERTFFSQTAYLLKGPSINKPIKFASIPCAPVSSRPLDGGSAELRNDLQIRLHEEGLCYRFAIQEYKEGLGFSVEDGMNRWDESQSPWIPIATIRIPKQTFMTDEKLRYCDNLSFQPWHALAQHRPLGNLNRSRKVVYEMISHYRHRMNREGDSLKEPENLDEWDSLQSPEYVEWRDVRVSAGR